MSITRCGVVLSILWMYASAAGAQPLTFLRADYASNTGARGVATADFDGNGWPDLAQANTGRNTLTILLNDKGRLMRTDDIAVGSGPFDVVAADFNRDLAPDLAVANADGHTISVVLGRRGGGIAGIRTVPAPGNPRGITAADMNRDGIPDIIYTAYQHDAVRILLSDGSGGFTAGSSFVGYAPRPQGVAAADFNRDGTMDVVVAYASEGGLAVLPTNARGAFSAARGVAAVPLLNVVTTGDFNRDGWMDAAAASSDTNRVAVFLGGPSGLAHQASYTTGASPRGIAAADFNADGRLDLAVANRNGNSVSVFAASPTAAGQFRPAVSVAAGAGSRSIVVADFDHDGRADVATGNEMASGATVLSNETVHPADAYAFDTVTIAEQSAAQWDAIAVADFNLNGKPDVAMPGQVVLDDGRITVLPGQGAGELAVGDFNRDGKPDIVRAGSYVDTLTTFLGNGSGGFTAAWQTTFRAGFLFAADMNRDGILDLVASGFTSAIFVRTYIGRGDGTFQAGADAPLHRTSVIDIGDVNNDGLIDVINPVSTIDGSHVAFLLGDGRGGFSVIVEHPVDGQFINMAKVADVNHDGLPDLIHDANRGSIPGVIAVELGVPGGGFADATTYPSTGIPNRYASTWGFEIEDIDRDGHVDIVFASILRGRGDGSFVPAEFTLPENSKAFVDYDRDGTVDIVHSTYEGAGVLLNRRERENQLPVLQPIGDSFTLSYLDLFEYEDEEGCSLCASASDADRHALSYEWRTPSGALVGYGESFRRRELPPGVHELRLTVTDGRGGVVRDSVTVTITPFKEIVTDVYPNCCGLWQAVEDQTAAEWVRAHHPNANAPKLAAPLANPASYVEVEFTADPSQVYKFWVRLKAQSNASGNDSIFVQFSGAANQAGTPVYRIGTTSGLDVNLEECSGCGLSGWGWRDERWGAALNSAPVLLRFPEGGRQRLRIQAREDGVSVDQIVLSAERFRTARPGAAKNDSTILGRTTY